MAGPVNDNLCATQNKSKFAITGALYDLEGVVKSPETNPTKKLHMQWLSHELEG